MTRKSRRDSTARAAIEASRKTVAENACRRATALERALKPNMDRARQQLADPSTDPLLQEAAQDMLDAAEALIHPPTKSSIFGSDVFNSALTYEPDATVQPHELLTMKKATKVVQ